MLAVAVAGLLLGQAGDAKLEADVDRQARLKALLAPIHLSDSVAPAVKEALERPVTLSFEKTPLPEVVARLAPLFGGNLRFDPGAPPEDGDGKHLPLPTVSCRCVKEPLKAVLEGILEQVGLDYRIAHEGIEIGALEYLQRVGDWRIYPVPDIFETSGPDGVIHLIQAIQEFVDREGWLPNGGNGIIEPLPGGALLVKCCPPTHRHVARFLAFARRFLGPRVGTFDVGEFDLGDPPPVRSRTVFLQPSEFFLPRLDAKLRQRFDFDLRDATVQQAIRTVERTIGVPIKADFKALEAQALAESADLRSQRITIARRGIQAKTALDLLREQGLHCVETADGLVAKFGDGESFSEFPYTWRFYPTGDLVAVGLQGLAPFNTTDCNQYLLGIVQEFSNEAILCFNKWPDFVAIDRFGVTGHFYRGPRIEHRRFEMLYAGLREALRRRPEILRLTAVDAK